MTYLGIALAGALGAPARFLLDGLVRRRTGSHRPADLPAGTLVVNVAGSFILGLITGLGLYHGLPRTPQVVLGAGLCGAFTTFSTFTFETVRLIEERARWTAAAYVAASVIAGLAAAAAGLALASLALASLALASLALASPA